MSQSAVLRRWPETRAGHECGHRGADDSCLSDICSLPLCFSSSISLPLSFPPSISVPLPLLLLIYLSPPPSPSFPLSLSPSLLLLSSLYISSPCSSSLPLSPSLSLYLSAPPSLSVFLSLSSRLGGAGDVFLKFRNRGSRPGCVCSCTSTPACTCLSQM